MIKDDLKKLNKSKREILNKLPTECQNIAALVFICIEDKINLVSSLINTEYNTVNYINTNKHSLISNCIEEYKLNECLNMNHN